MPPFEKRKIELKELQNKINLLFLWLAIVLLVFIGLLTTTYFILYILLQTQEDLITERQANQKTQEVSQMGERIDQINQRLEIIAQQQNNSVIWTPLLLELNKLTPEDVYLISLNYQGQDKDLHISGYAQTRDGLLTFRDQLKQSPYFADLESPLSNIIKQAEINFIFTAKPVYYSSLKE